MQMMSKASTASCFNMCPVNLMNMRARPLETFNSLLLITFSITSTKTFKADPDNTSDHLPIQLTLTINYNFASCAGNSQRSKKMPKIKWSKFSLEVINTQYVTPLLHDLENSNIDFSDSGKAVDKISKLITHHSASLADPGVVTAKRKNKRNVYVRLPEDVKTARSHWKVAFESWKNNDYSDGNGIDENYRLKRREYRFKLRNFRSKLEAKKSHQTLQCSRL